MAPPINHEWPQNTPWLLQLMMNGLSGRLINNSWIGNNAWEHTVHVQWNLYIKTTQGTSQRWSLKRSGLFTEVLYRT